MGVWDPYQNDQEAISLLKHAFELGINFIDTADSYGSGMQAHISPKHCLNIQLLNRYLFQIKLV
ncbi:aldo/keto reductase [Ligilactobacillus acidipiscis]|uniref:aldo/keto reductase n=1 Tax=Ligilactobacillus acidipiscis TaxID=89059 RepID=UPI0032AED220